MTYRYHQGEWVDFDPSRRSYSDTTSSQQMVFYALLMLFSGYYILQKIDYFPLLPLQELLWNALVYVTPSSLVMALDRGQEVDKAGYSDFTNYSDSRTFAAKSAAMRRILGFQGVGLFSALSRPRAFSGVSSLLKGHVPYSLPGLGNWDNSCYQNSIIQGLASLPSVKDFLERIDDDSNDEERSSTRAALSDIISQLNDPENGGRRLWTPAALKSMSSWQQQDAQEYYSKILDDIEKEATSNMQRQQKHDGLRMIKAWKGKDEGQSGRRSGQDYDGEQDSQQESVEQPTENRMCSPLEGLLAQRVGCLECGYVEGLSLVPFNCITLPLSRSFVNNVADCLDDFTQLERIDGVECGRCTLLRQERNLQELLSREKPGMESFFAEARERLSVVQQALLDDDYSENTLSKRCQIPGKQRVSSTKTKQTVLARAPESLVLHINRSVFDEMTGMLSKNSSNVSFPEALDLGCWSIGAGSGEIEEWSMDPHTSLLTTEFVQTEPTDDAARIDNYVLRAVITHYGRHENGHYICYRRDPNDDEQWWRLSDDDVSPANSREVLEQGNVFMLFYTRSSATDVSRQIPAVLDGFTAEAPMEQEFYSDAAEQDELIDATPEDTPLDAHDQDAATPALPETLTAILPEPALVTAAAPTTNTEDMASTPQETTDSVQDDAEARYPAPIPDMWTKDMGSDGSSPKNVLPPMRTASSAQKRSRKGSRPGMPSMSNMVVAN